MITRLRWLIFCALGFSSCSTYQTVNVDGKTPIFEFESSQMPQVLKVLADVAVKYADEGKALEKGPDERETGTCNFGFQFVGASGQTPDGSKADGYILRESLRIRTKDKNSPKILKIKALIDKARTDVLAGFSSIKKPTYVDKAILD